MPRVPARLAESNSAVLVSLPGWKRASNRPDPEVRAAPVRPHRAQPREQSLRPVQLLRLVRLLPPVQFLPPVRPRRPRTSAPEQPLPARSPQAVQILPLPPAQHLARQRGLQLQPAARAALGRDVHPSVRGTGLRRMREFQPLFERVLEFVPASGPEHELACTPAG